MNSQLYSSNYNALPSSPSTFQTSGPNWSGVIHTPLNSIYGWPPMSSSNRGFDQKKSFFFPMSLWLLPSTFCQAPSGKRSKSSYTEGEIKVCTWLREISSCSCLTVLPGPAWVLLSKIYKPLFPPLYATICSSEEECLIPLKSSV